MMSLAGTSHSRVCDSSPSSSVSSGEGTIRNGGRVRNNHVSAREGAHAGGTTTTCSPPRRHNNNNHHNHNNHNKGQHPMLLFVFALCVLSSCTFMAQQWRRTSLQDVMLMTPSSYAAAAATAIQAAVTTSTALTDKREDVTVGAASAASDASTTHEEPLLSAQQQHIVFIGDSVLRNSYLELLDQIHYGQESTSSLAPDQLIDSSMYSSYTDYFRYTSMVHFQGYMFCDCRRSSGWGKGSANEIENRYYSRGNVTATYLQGYGDGMAHGRYHPHEIKQWAQSKASVYGTGATSNINDMIIINNNNSTSRRLLWGYRGLDWDQLLLRYVSRLRPKPTAIVMNAGLGYPTDELALNMGRILQAALDVVGEEGVIVWRETGRGDGATTTTTATAAAADQAAKDWSYRIRGIQYHPFPSKAQLTRLSNSSQQQGHYQYFNDSGFYRFWNMELSKALWEKPRIQQVAFVLVGGVRTLPGTHHTMMQNLVRQLCPPYRCKSHLVLHLSGADNRPDPKNIDPKGVSKPLSRDQHVASYFQHPSQYNWPADFLQFHWIDEPYEIGSPDEHTAMNLYEKFWSVEFSSNRTVNNELVRRLQVFRFGDPRRYSMWFARAWAWRSVQNLGVPFDYYVFVRPDLQWCLPVPTMTFFRDFAGRRRRREIWLPDRYYANAPDTLAFLPSQSAAEDYFSLSALVRPGVACLGGPDLNNRTLVEGRLRERSVTVLETDWCPNSYHAGWSEQILSQKLDKVRLIRRYVPLGVSIWRPRDQLRWSTPHLHGQLMCEPLDSASFFLESKHARTQVPFWACLLAEYTLQKSWPATLIKNISSPLSSLSSSSSSHPPLAWAQVDAEALPVQLFRWRSRHAKGDCLTRVVNRTVVQWVAKPCQHPPTVEQVYATNPVNEKEWVGFNMEHFNVFPIEQPELDWGFWFPEPMKLYSSTTLASVQ